MVDFILLLFTLAMFAAGFWCGKTYGTSKNMLKSWWGAVRGTVDDMTE